MNLAQAIHARWATLDDLNALLGADRVTGGTHFQSDPGEAYAVITLPGGTIESQLNDGSLLANLVVRILVHHADCQAGRAVVDAVWAGFGRAELPMEPGGKVICMLPASAPVETQDPETGHWQWVLDFECRVHLPGTTGAD